MAAPPPQTFPYDFLFKVLIIGDASVGKVCRGLVAKSEASCGVFFWWVESGSELLTFSNFLLLLKWQRTNTQEFDAFAFHWWFVWWTYSIDNWSRFQGACIWPFLGRFGFRKPFGVDNLRGGCICARFNNIHDCCDSTTLKQNELLKLTWRLCHDAQAGAFLCFSLSSS